MELDTMKFLIEIAGQFALPIIILMAISKWLLTRVEDLDTRLKEAEERNNDLQVKVITKDNENDKKAIGMLKTMWELQHKSNEQLEKIVTNNTEAVRSFGASIDKLTVRVESIEEKIEKFVQKSSRE